MDACHEHVSQCSHSLLPGELFAKEELFFTVTAKRKRGLIVDYLRYHVPRGVLEAVITAVGPYTKDLEPEITLRELSED